MQDLTFGEQVKIILSRKDMTIKELARKIERRTGKKMSRQNLTQRLGRDNFQEQDMRMIAEILECPFYLNILDDGILTEKAVNETEAAMHSEGRELDKQAGTVKSDAKEAGKTEATAGEQPEAGRTEVKEAKETAGEQSEPKGAQEPGTTVGERLEAEEAQEPGTTAGEQSEPKEAESMGSGETAGKRLEAEEAEATAAKEAGTTAEERLEAGKAEAAVAKEAGTTAGEQSEPKEAESMESGALDGKANERDITIGELVDIHKKLDVLENSAGNKSSSEEAKAESKDQENQADKEYADVEPKESAVRYTREAVQGYQESAVDQEALGYQESVEYQEEYAQEMSEEPVEELLKEIESLERSEKKEEKQEEKPRGWRAYFKQRFKKFKDQTVVREELPDEQVRQNQAAHDTEGIPHEGTEVRYTEAGDTGAGYDTAYQEGYPRSAYEQADYTETYPAGYEETGYLEAGYEETGYPENGDADMRYGENGYPEDGYAEDVQEEAIQEEDAEQGEINPYTGMEYESNSVRMHPSRIGYVQVYDREGHQWTDMTEWAFLGYQERKKQLLGKDYDSPIYLD